MKKYTILVLIFFSTIILSANLVTFSENDNKQLFEHVSFGLDRTEISFNLDQFELIDQSVRGEIYSKLIITDSGCQYETGKPDLPKISKLFAIPDQGNVTVNLINSTIEYIDNIKVFPFQEEDAPADIFQLDNNYYSSDQVFPAEIIEISEPAIMRDIRLISVSVNPFQYDPVNNRIIVHKNIELEIVTDNTAGINENLSSSNQSKAFNKLYKSSIQNYSAVSTRDEFQQPCYLFIYPNNTQVSDNLNLLTEWRHKSGYEVHKISTATTGTSASEIKNYIQNAYDNWPNPPEYVCLVGDANGTFSVPTEYMGGGEGDQYYARLDGTDILADVFIGRLSFGTITEFQTILSKIINYEQNPYMGNTDWYNKTLLIGDPSHSGSSTIDCNLYIKDIMTATNENNSFIENYSGGYVSTISSAIDGGVSYFNYRGYLNMSGWGNSNTNSLNNGFMLPVAVILTCGTGSFASGTARSEEFLRAGTPSVPKGGIASIGTATISTHTMFNNCVAGGTFHGIFGDQMYNMGSALTRGKLNLFESYPNLNYDGGAVYRFSYWNNLMGEPAMPLWTDVPQEMVVTYPEEIGLGTNYIEISVSDQADTPLVDTWVTILQGDDAIFATGYTDAYGKIIFDLPDDIVGSVDITATRHNFIPFSDDFSIQFSNQNIALESYVINDNNGDLLINPGETVSFDVTLKNTGMFTAENIQAIINCNNDYVTINNANANFGSIVADETAVVTEAFSITLDSDIPGGLEIRLDLTISDNDSNQWEDMIEEYSGAPKLNFTDYTVYDADGVLNPGETSDISLTLTNIGLVNAEDVSGVITCSNGNVVVNDSLGFFSLITTGNQGNNNSDKFNLTVNSYMIPGSQIPFNLHLYNSSGYDENVQIILNIGEVNVQDPLGPDGYGYYCYDDGDTDYLKCPTFDWIEIASTQAGPGTSLSFVDWGNGGKTETIDLDIHFQFYGEVYDQISICTNGWISPGVNESESYMNWNIPGSLGPSPIIAPFWDDMTTNTGNVYYYYDASLQYFVIQWEDMQSDYSSAHQTFQAIIYDSYAYPTTTGDSEILFQYKDVTNNSVGSYNYPFNHGQYATIGIEDPTATIGLEYTFNDTYPTAAKEIQNEMAILFTSPPIPIDGPFMTVFDYDILSGDDLFIESGEDVTLGLTLENIGPETATDLDITISCNDDFITIIDNAESVSSVATSQQIMINNAFTMEIASSTPDVHSFLLDVEMVSAEGNWVSAIPLIVYEPNDIETNPLEYNILVEPSSTNTSIFTISNIGNGILDYTIRTEELRQQNNLRNLTGSYIYPEYNGFTPGETAIWTFYAYNGSPDNEWIKDIYIDFPAGVNVLNSSNMVGGSGGDMIYSGATGSGAGIHWYGESDLGYGYLHHYQTAVASVQVEITTEIAGNLTIDYVLQGDEYGDAPHVIEDSFIMEYPLRWISLASSSGNISSGQSDDIEITFDTNTLEMGNYYCDIIVNSTNSWDTRVIPITLNVDYVNSPEQTIPMKTSLSANYPNPFNPETKIAFSLHESSKTNLTIYNVKGEKVKVLVNDYLPAADYDYTWDGKDSNNKKVSSGIYFYKLESNRYHATKKMVLMK